MSTEIETLAMSHEDYRKHPAVNQSSLKVLAESPQLYYGRFVSGYIPHPEPTPAMEFGSTVEAYIRNGGTHNYVLLPPHIKQRRGAAYEEFRDSLPPGTEVLIRSEWEERRIGDLELIAANLRQHEKSRVILERGEWHRRLVWGDADTGLDCKAEPDLVCQFGETVLLADLKTAADTSEEAFAKSVVNFGYDLQAYWYTWGYQEIGRAHV